MVLRLEEGSDVGMIIKTDIESGETIRHIGRPHEGMTPHSGRYKWGSGSDPYQKATNFLAEIERLQKKLGYSEVEAAESLGMNTAELRTRKALAKDTKRQGDIAIARQMREKGVSYAAIAERLGVSISTARKLSEGGQLAKSDKIADAKKLLEDSVKDLGYVEYGLGTEVRMGVSSTQLNTAIQALKDAGYTTHIVHVKQLGLEDEGKFTELKVLAKPGITKEDVLSNRDKIRSPRVTIDEGGNIKGLMQTPVSISSKRIKVVYDEDGGSKMDGVVELRRGVPELTIANGVYAQVRIAVDKTHYVKGMAVYADDLPAGVDMRVNSNKKRGTPVCGPKNNTVLKLNEGNDPVNPFGASVTQKKYKDPKTGKSKLSALNYVREEGQWDQWSRNLASQYLSKQLPSEAKRQLKKTRDKLQQEYKEIMALTNPVVKRRMLQDFADKVDGKSVDLKAAAYPRQAIQVILPLPKIKEGEVYAPNYKHGERLALIRYPHAGTFEIPEVTVNNKSASGKKRIGSKAKDAIGVHPKVAERLSGADFDGDFVVVIPNNDRKVRSTPALQGLKGFDPKKSYPYREGMKVMTKKSTQIQMGSVSNLITDMTIRGASKQELARAVRHSMVVIDAAKHRLDYKQSEKDNGIAQLKKKYQGGANAGASTIVSRASSPVYMPHRTLRKASEGGSIDPKTGKYVWVESGKGRYAKRKTASGQWVETDRWIPKMTKASKMSLTDDAHTLSSGTKIESIYADHANSLKGLANQARKDSLKVGKTPYDPKAAVKYSREVKSMRAKLKEAYNGKPLERQAQVVANSTVRMKVQADPTLRTDKKRRAKVERQAIKEARARTGAQRFRITLSDSEWTAIQKGAIRENMLTEIIRNADSDHIAKLATPRSSRGISAAQASRMRSLVNAGYTNAEVAEALGVSTSTVVDYLRK